MYSAFICVTCVLFILPNPFGLQQHQLNHREQKINKGKYFPLQIPEGESCLLTDEHQDSCLLPCCNDLLNQVKSS